MIESLNDAKEEMKRVDHLIYVSLKYTRTVDVLKNALNRMIDAYDFIFEALLRKAMEEEKIEEIPTTPIERGNKIKDLYEEDQQIIDNVELFFLIRKIWRAPNPEKEQEFRRHVTMRVMVDGREELVNIDIITQYYHFQLEFIRRIESLLNAEQED
ncbi:hypothetical protein K9M18_00240 [Candidatus Woesearchaeota archaeon]|nr:hypothetical protein [Candidatus Woesearchaeota archaeon]MCF8012955.1 hypothetical protein [Candidatus Woesearchaeota archaeon]